MDEMERYLVTFEMEGGKAGGREGRRKGSVPRSCATSTGVSFWILSRSVRSRRGREARASGESSAS